MQTTIKGRRRNRTGTSWPPAPPPGPAHLPVVRDSTQDDAAHSTQYALPAQHAPKGITRRGTVGPSGATVRLTRWAAQSLSAPAHTHLRRRSLHALQLAHGPRRLRLHLHVQQPEPLLIGAQQEGLRMGGGRLQRGAWHPWWKDCRDGRWKSPTHRRGTEARITVRSCRMLQDGCRTPYGGHQPCRYQETARRAAHGCACTMGIYTQLARRAAGICTIRAVGL